MKAIHKAEPPFFSEYINKTRPDTWSDISFGIGLNIRQYMLEGVLPDGNCQSTSEQNSQCGYTEEDIVPDSSRSHIDHYLKRSFFPDREWVFNWNNMITASNCEYYGAKYKDKTIRKDDYKYLINPVTENPQQYFIYTSAGKIIARNNSSDSIEFLKAEKTIQLFNLNDKALVNKRYTVIKQVLAMFPIS